MRRLGSLLFALGLVGCSKSFDPPSYVSGLRVLAIKAEPPEVAPGQSSTVTALAVATDGAAIAFAWSECDKAPLPGQAINRDCFTTDLSMQSYLTNIGSGATIDFLMPMVSATDLGEPDATGGVYVALRADAATSQEASTSSYRLRLAGPSAPNRNPTLAGVFQGGGISELDAAQPPTVHAGDELTLRGVFSAGSAESYSVAGRAVTELLTIAWFATSGSFNSDVTGESTDTVLKLDKNLPPSGSAIDLWLVGRDERGGTDYVHRTLSFQ
ncbi:MAG: putative lipoprotein [bacterium]|nr:putative lipoprotein [bacterium]